MDGVTELARMLGKGAQHREGRARAVVTRIDADGTTWAEIAGGAGEFPVTRMLASAAEGDWIEVAVRDGQAVGMGNVTDPAASTSRVDTTERKADAAQASAAVARAAAESAVTDAQRAYEAADAAQQSADSAATAAGAAQGSADAAATAAATANEKAAQAIADAATAQGAATAAQGSADAAAAAASVADGKAVAAGQAASSAQASADHANRYANAALDQLGVVQDVAGVLSWASEHGSFEHTSDTSVVEGKVYFTFDGTDYTPVVEPQAADLASYYELTVDEAMNEYILAHLAVTNRGLWVLPAGIGQASDEQHAPGYKMLLASDGMYLYDSEGVLVTTYGESITFDSDRPQRIGSETAYIEYYDSDNDGHPDSIRISGTNLNAEIANFKQTVSETYATKAEAKQTDSASGLRELPTEDAAELPMLGLTVHGECAQDGTPTPDAPVEIRSVRGRNLLNESAIKRNVIVSSQQGAEVTVTDGRSCTDYIEVNPLTTYTLRNPDAMSYGSYSVIYFDESKTFVGKALSYMGGGQIASFTTPENTHYVRVNVSGIDVGNNVLQLELGPTPTPYVPYGCVSIISHGKNFVPQPNGTVGRISAEGNSYSYGSTDGQVHAISNGIEVESNAEYTFSFDNTDAGSTDSHYVALAWYDADGVFISRPDNFSGRKAVAKTYTSPNNAAYARVSAHKNVYPTLQLERGTEATDYEPYRESVSYIDLKGEELCSLPDGTQDVLTVDASGHAVVEKRVDSLTKAIADMGDSQDYPGWRPSGISEIIGSGVNSNISHNTALSNIKDSGIIYGANTQNGDSLFLTRAYYGLTSDEWKAQYPDLLVTIYAKRAEPRTVDLGYIDLPTTFPHGTVHVEAEIQPVIDGSWWTAAGYEAGKAYNDGNGSADLAALTERVTTAESSITQQAGQIASKVSQSDFNTLSGRVSTAESTITQHSTDIEAKVSKDGVIAAINLSTETEGGSAVKISADKVNIEGAAIFTGSGRLSQSSLDGAYDASGAASTAVGNLKTDLASSSGTTVIDGGHISTNSLTVGQVSGLQGTLDGKASTAAVESAAKRTYVSIRATAIDYAAGTATLEATLFVDGAAVTSGVTYAWMVDGAAISGAASRTYSVPASSGLEHAYSCKCTATV